MGVIKSVGFPLLKRRKRKDNALTHEKQEVVRADGDERRRSSYAWESNRVLAACLVVLRCSFVLGWPAWVIARASDIESVLTFLAVTFCLVGVLLPQVYSGMAVYLVYCGNVVCSATCYFYLFSLSFCSYGSFLSCLLFPRSDMIHEVDLVLKANYWLFFFLPSLSRWRTALMQKLRFLPLRSHSYKMLSPLRSHR